MLFIIQGNVIALTTNIEGSTKIKKKRDVIKGRSKIRTLNYLTCVVYSDFIISA